MTNSINGLPPDPNFPPLREDEGGVVRVGKTRVSIDVVVEQYESDMTPDEMVQAYDALRLADVDSVIAAVSSRFSKLLRRNARGESLTGH